MGLALGPRSGPNTLTIGDAAGTVNPFNGEGIAYGYETGRIAAAVVAEALLANDSSLLGLYDERLESGLRRLLQGRARVRADHLGTRRSSRPAWASGCASSR